MADYGFVHDGKVFTPNGTQDVPAVTNDDRNQAIEAGELARWQGQPDRMLAYYHFPASVVGSQTIGPVTRPYRQSFYPTLIGRTSNGNGGSVERAHVTTWLGTTLGTIVSAKVYTHNFGGRFVSLRVRGTNGASYYGRASWDNGQCVWLRKVKG